MNTSSPYNPSCSPLPTTQQPQSLVLIDLDATQPHTFSLTRFLLNDMAEATVAYAQMGNTEPPCISYAWRTPQHLSSLTTLVLATAHEDAAPNDHIKALIAQAEAVYGLLCYPGYHLNPSLNLTRTLVSVCTDSPASACINTPARWKGLLALTGCSELHRTHTHPRMGWTRRTYAHALDTLVAALRLQVDLDHVQFRVSSKHIQALNHHSYIVTCPHPLWLYTFLSQ